MSPDRYKKILFILKFRDYDYGDYGCVPSYGEGLSSGLFNSARMVVDMLCLAGVNAKLVQVVDNNDIDREVSFFKPDVVVIEGLWVVPRKFLQLVPLHPKVQWIVRIHSEIPFLSMEGVALDWIPQYIGLPNVMVACNSDRGYRDILDYVIAVHYSLVGLGTIRGAKLAVLLLPNYYRVEKSWWEPPSTLRTINIGCFGAIRPLKNQLIQAMAAVEFAAMNRKKLKFYITVRDCEQGGDQVLKNIRALFKWTGNDLVELPWMGHEDFLGIFDWIDVGMAVSLSESFCIVAADMVNAGVPVVVSPEIRWASRISKADPTSISEIVEKLDLVTKPIAGPIGAILNHDGLAKYSQKSKAIWLDFLKR